jgi:hypothetical protein
VRANSLSAQHRACEPDARAQTEIRPVAAAEAGARVRRDGSYGSRPGQSPLAIPREGLLSRRQLPSLHECAAGTIASSAAPRPGTRSVGPSRPVVGCRWCWISGSLALAFDNRE